MARAQPILVYLRPKDRKALEVVAQLRNMSYSLTLVDLVRDAFSSAYGCAADPAEVITRIAAAFHGQVIQTQRAKRKRRAMAGAAAE
jgi:hypothetical protein